ncbi:MAG TPA: proteasome subunit alpha, partial [Halobacteriales archaeon]|nr:proteasome subunit alpha [Halobacteriales archaeon]
SLDDGVGLALEALASVNDGVLSPESVGVATVDAETEQFATLDDDEVEGHLVEHGLLESESESDEEDDEE